MDHAAKDNLEAVLKLVTDKFEGEMVHAKKDHEEVVRKL